MNCPICHDELVVTTTTMENEQTGERSSQVICACVICRKLFSLAAGVLVEERVHKVTTETCPRCGGRRVIVDEQLGGCLGCGEEGADA